MYSEPVKPLEKISIVSPSHAWHLQWRTRVALSHSAFWQTTLAILRAPQAFAAAWADGSREAMNPVTYFGVALTLTSPLVVAAKFYNGEPIEGGTMFEILFEHFEPYVQFIVVGLLCHVFLRLLSGGATRGWHYTLGVALFASGPAAAADAVAALANTLLNVAVSETQDYTVRIAELTAAFSVIAVDITFIVTLVFALCGVHRMTWPRVLFAWLVSQLIWTSSKVFVFWLVLRA